MTYTSDILCTNTYCNECAGVTLGTGAVPTSHLSYYVLCLYSLFLSNRINQMEQYPLSSLDRKNKKGKVS
jgi:hypothetical protein